jgi:hypothetical protein
MPAIESVTASAATYGRCGVLIGDIVAYVHNIKRNQEDIGSVPSV